MNRQANDSDGPGSQPGTQVNPVAVDATLIFQATTPAFVLTVDQSTLYTIDDQAFAQIDDEDLEVDLNSEYPSRDLDRLVTNAVERGALIGDPRLELTIYEGDDADGPGYYVVLSNRHGDQRLVGITSGWTELDYVAPDATPSEQAREYLSEVCNVANTVLGFASKAPHLSEVSQP